MNKHQLRVYFQTQTNSDSEYFTSNKLFPNFCELRLFYRSIRDKLCGQFRTNTISVFCVRGQFERVSGQFATNAISVLSVTAQFETNSAVNSGQKQFRFFAWAVNSKQCPVNSQQIQFRFLASSVNSRQILRSIPEKCNSQLSSTLFVLLLSKSSRRSPCT